MIRRDASVTFGVRLIVVTDWSPQLVTLNHYGQRAVRRRVPTPLRDDPAAVKGCATRPHALAFDEFLVDALPASVAHC